MFKKAIAVLCYFPRNEIKTLMNHSQSKFQCYSSSAFHLDTPKIPPDRNSHYECNFTYHPLCFLEVFAELYNMLLYTFAKKYTYICR